MYRTDAEREAEILANDAAYEELRRQSLAQEADSSESGFNSEIPTPASFSTGPTSLIGKQISSRNALKHGSCSDKTIILANERKEDYDAIEKMLFDSYKPTNEHENHMVQEIVNATWFHQRATHNVNTFEEQTLQFRDIMEWNDYDHIKMTRFLRYQTTRANNLKRAIKALEDHRKNRLNETIKIETHEIRKKKAEPETNPFDELEELSLRIAKIAPLIMAADVREILKP